ncbi:flagellar brake protein [Rhodocyclus tenuis]|uniref:C-di-GMP-binding flagellar brake protein YcgR n=1 Tax=Rhodocyclus tenuis TaxID=1066 RepID=A0A840GDM3_RHOTE|nr:flagellar brake protein [Rhodocyclus tenuis]MBB4248738.1 c-di-GMP-binding flagellar brake protein YcgR [Rhodocyclus tenuis]
MARIAISENEIELGKPLSWDVLDPEGNRLAAAGDIVHTKAHLKLLISGQACREQPEQGPAAAGGDETGATGLGGQESSFTFEEMKLKIGDRLQIQPPARFAMDRVIVRLIGYVKNLSVLVSAPRETNGLRLQIVEGDDLVVRVFTSQNAFGFSATVEKLVKIPFEYLHLSFPAEVKGVVIRKAPRVKSRLVCSVTSEETGEEHISGILVNISAKGALLASRRPLGKKGGTIRVAFRVNLHSIETLLSISAIVRAQFVDENSANSKTSLINHGLEFINLQPNDTLILQSMIYQQMIEQPETLL